MDFYEELGEHLVPGEVAIVMEAGHEKARYVHAQAVAVTKTDAGKVQLIAVSINDIYGMVESKWGVKPNPAEY